MTSQKKRFAFYALLIALGFAGAYAFLREKTPFAEIGPGEHPKNDSIVSVSLLTEFIDLENNSDGYVTSEKAASGENSCKLSEIIEFGVGNSKTVKDIPGHNTLKSIAISFKCSSEKKDPEAVYVLSIDDREGKNIFWDSRPIKHNNAADWSAQSLRFTIPPEYLNPENKIVVYPWNRNKRTLYIDDITVDYIGTAVYKEVPANASEKSNLFFDFESETGLSTADNVKETTAHSGKKACDLRGGKEYGPSVNKKLSELSPSLPKRISMSVWVYPLSENVNIVLNTSAVNSKNETVFWEGESSENKGFPKNTWTKINASFGLPAEKLSPDDILGVGIWNKGKTDVIVDDLEIVYGEGAERRGEPSRIDPVSIYEKRFVQQKNKPPFRTIWLGKQEIRNANSISLTPPDKKNIADNFLPEDEFIVADFYPDTYGLEEVLHIGSAFKGLYRYSPEAKRFERLWDSPLVADSIWNRNNSFYAGDFNSDGKTDILVVNKHNNDWGLITFSGKEWNIKAQGNNPKKEWLAKKTKENVFPGIYFDGKQTSLLLSLDWRFDLKLLDGDLILGNVDFKGYPEDHNPKYYESVKLIPGKFMSKDQTSLLVVMCNCADANYAGGKCENIEDLPYLPNSVQLYAIEKEESMQLTHTNSTIK